MLVIVIIKIKIIFFFGVIDAKKKLKKSEPHSHIANFKVWE